MKDLRKIVLVPTYNEKDSVTALLERLAALSVPKLEIWVIDDSSPDGTGKIVSDYARTHPNVRLITRTEKNGLGEAYKHAMKMIQGQQDIAAVLTIDADGSHDPVNVPDLFDALEKGSDVAIGSRYVKGGAISGWDRKRLILSSWGNFYVRTLTGFPIRDATAGFVAYRRTALDGINLDSISSAGYSFQIEMKNALVENGARFTEVPITFYERRLGVSKVSGNIVAEGLLIPFHLLMQKIRRTKPVMLLAAVLLIASVFFSFYKLTESPSVWYDEGLYSQVAAHIAHGEPAGLQVAPGNITQLSKLSVGYPLTYPVALFYKLFGTNVAAARSFMALTIIGAVLAALMLARMSFMPGVALFSLALVAMFPPLYGNGKSVLGEVPGIFYLLVSLGFFQAAIRKPRAWMFFLAGLFVGLAAVTKPIFILAVPAFLLAAIIGIRRKEIPWKHLLAGVVAAIISFGVWIITQFHAGDTLRDVIGFYGNPQPGQSMLQAVVSNIAHSFKDLGLVYLGILLLVWITSVVIRMRQKRRVGTVEWASITFSLLIFAAYFRTAGYDRYIFPAQIVALVYFPEAVARVFSVIRSRMKLSSLFQATVIPILMLLLFVAGVYQLMFHSWVADYYSSHKTAYWQEYFATHDLSNVLFYDVPEVAMFDRSASYSQYLNVAPAAKISLGDSNIDLFKKGGFDTVFMTSSTYDTLRAAIPAVYHVVDQPYKYVILARTK